VSLITRVTRLLRADTRQVFPNIRDPLQSLSNVQDELDLCCILANTDPARSFVRQRLDYVVRIVNEEQMVSA
jgi:hypothetical protein